MADQHLVGLTGSVTSAVRGGDEPGEVRVVDRGMPQHFIAFCPVGLPVGAPVLVVNSRGHRQVDVEPWDLSLA